MRICMVAYTFYEIDTRVRMYAEVLVQRGDKVDVIALRKRGQARTGNVNGVRVIRIQRRNYNERSKLSYLLKVLWFFLQSMLVLTWHHFRREYDVIHVHSVPDFEVFAAWFPKLTGAKIILDVHDLVPEFYASKFGAGQQSVLYKLLLVTERRAAAFSDHVIAANDLWRERMIARCVPSKSCTAIINFPVASRFKPAKRQGPNGHFVILYPGTLNHHQGVDLAVNAFAKIKERAPHAVFHIYGQGGETDALAKLITHLGLEERVLLRDFLPSSQIAEVMATADLGVVPKRKNSFGNEAFSTKILEFMSCRVPVLVSDTRIDRHYFNDSLVKFFKGDDVEDLARAMLSMIENREAREALVENAWTYICENTWEKKRFLYFDIVDSLRRRSAPPVAVVSNS